MVNTVAPSFDISAIYSTQHALAFLVYYAAMVSMETKHRIGLCTVIQMSSFLLLNIRPGERREGLIACILLCSASAHKRNYKIQFCLEFLLFPLMN
jgi:hypothetical protein